MAETIFDGPPSAGDTERALVEVAAERDQLRQQVEGLLEAVDAHQGEWDESYLPKGPDRKTEPVLAAVWDDDQALYKVADQVRKELGEG